MVKITRTCKCKLVVTQSTSKMMMKMIFLMRMCDGPKRKHYAAKNNQIHADQCVVVVLYVSMNRIMHEISIFLLMRIDNILH